MSTGAFFGASPKHPQQVSNLSFNANLGFGILIVASILGAFIWDQPLLFGLPLLALFVFIAIVDYRQLFFVLFALIPLSFEYNFPNGLGTDLPDEPLMWMLTGISLLYFLGNLKNLSSRLITHPITLILLLHLAWFFLTTILADSIVFSVKFFAAKIWYVTVFYFLAFFILKKPSDRNRLFWFVLIPLLFTVLFVFIREAGIGFSFKEIHFVMGPFYRNHVAYASIIALFIPFVWFKSKDQNISVSLRIFLKCVFAFFLLALILSFTRAAMLAVVAALGFYWVIRWHMVKYMILVISIAIIGGVGYMAKDNKYLEFAPNFDKTVMHDQFGNLINATYQLEDISTMERVYRWVAGFNMIVDRPWFGVGPGNFYNAYQSYTVTSFSTYVSDNPEHSGIHSYYLMTTVEQGVIGGIIFLLFVFAVFLYSERMYHKIEDLTLKNELMSYLLCFFIICVLQIINDLIETDKVGTFFWLCIAMVIRISMNAKDKTVITFKPVEIEKGNES